MLKRGEEFVADGVYLNVAEGRCYLWTDDYRGWICERRRLEFSSLAVELAGGEQSEARPKGRSMPNARSHPAASGGLEGAKTKPSMQDQIRLAKARLQRGKGKNENATSVGDTSRPAGSNHNPLTGRAALARRLAALKAAKVAAGRGTSTPAKRGAEADLSDETPAKQACRG
jgi:hypothetical protein